MFKRLKKHARVKHFRHHYLAVFSTSKMIETLLSRVIAFLSSARIVVFLQKSDI